MQEYICAFLIILIAFLILCYLTKKSEKAEKSGFNGNEYAWKEDSAGGAPLKDVDYENVGSYNDFIQQRALDKSVVDGQNTWIDSIPHRTTVASSSVVRDDSNDLNVSVGLIKPNYQDSMAQSQPESRQVSTEEPWQMPAYKRFCLPA
jgi:hypothetical protein